MDAHESRFCGLKWIFNEWLLDSFFSVILDSKGWMLDSNAEYSGFHKQKFPGFQNPDYLARGDMLLTLHFNTKIHTCGQNTFFVGKDMLQSRFRNFLENGNLIC